jgi:hypothetical protein
MLHSVESFMGWLCAAGSNRPAFMATGLIATSDLISGSSRKTASGLARNLQPE